MFERGKAVKGGKQQSY
jgi:hypothetical protein